MARAVPLMKCVPMSMILVYPWRWLVLSECRAGWAKAAFELLSLQKGRQAPTYI